MAPPFRSWRSPSWTHHRLQQVILYSLLRLRHTTSTECYSTSTDIHKLDCTDDEKLQTKCLGGGECFAMMHSNVRKPWCRCLEHREGPRCQFQKTDLNTDIENTQLSPDSHKLDCTRLEKQQIGCMAEGKCFAMVVSGIRSPWCSCGEHREGHRCELQKTWRDSLPIKSLA